MTDVLWWTDKPGIRNRGYADQGVLEDILFGPHELNHIYDPADLRDGAIVVLPARWYVGALDEINEVLDRLAWALVILCGDEEASFPWRELKHPNMLVWAQTPHEGVHEGVRRKMETGYWAGTPALLASIDPQPRTTNWFYAGQVNNPDRKACAQALVSRLLERQDGVLLATGRFASGMAHADYLAQMTRSIVSVCPPGSFTPCTFRVFESLEAGCIPITLSHGYWPWLFDEPAPWPMLEDWDHLGEALDEVLSDADRLANRCSAFWMRRKALLAHWLDDDLRALGAI